MDHAEVHVVGVEALEKVLEGGAHLLEVARAHVLPALPRGAEVPLDDPALATAEKGVTEVERRVGSGIQQSRTFTPAASAASTTARVSSGAPSIHSPPKPISLTRRPVRPSSL